MKVIIDRFEGIYAVCEKEDRTIINIKRSLIPQQGKEGDVLFINEDKITLDIVETEKRRKQIEDLTKDLWA